MLFEWDDGNRQKVSRRISIEAVEASFRRPVKLWKDLAHSLDEERQIMIATDATGRYLWVCFTLRGLVVRVISARYMHKKEWSRYVEVQKT